MKHLVLACMVGALAVMLVAPLCEASGLNTLIFEEPFDDASSAASFSVTKYEPSGDDTYIEYAFDYSAAGPSRLTAAIGSPAGGGSATGLLVGANLTGLAADSGVNFYPIIAALTGSYRLTFDVWAGVNGVSGTTEFVMAGAQASGTFVNIDAGSPPFDERDGDFFELTTEGGITSDFITFTRKGGTQIAETFIGNTTEPLPTAMPNPPYPVQGAPGELWTEVEVLVSPSVTEFLINGVKIAEVAGSDWTSGLPFVGYTDIFSSVAGGDSPKVATGEVFDPFNASMAIIDNVRVYIPEPSSFVLLGVGLIGLAVARRKQR